MQNFCKMSFAQKNETSNAVRFVCVTVIIERFGFEETFKIHLVQPSCNEQGHLQLDS